MAKILNGKIVRDKIAEKLKKEIKELNGSVELAVIQIGDRVDSSAYIEQKKKFGEMVGAKVVHLRFEETVKESEIISEIVRLNEDILVNGIILQLPIPKHLSSTNIIGKIDPKKDVDGLTAENVKKLIQNDSSGMIPATARGIISLLNFYKISVVGKKVVIVGRSLLVGKPTAMALLNRNATVTICHSKTKNIEEITKLAEIVIMAVGKPEFFGKKYFKKGQVIVDVGINMKTGKKLNEEIPNTKFVGDVNFDEVKGIVKAISPVPCGVGPMTVASLFENLLDAYLKQKRM